MGPIRNFGTLLHSTLFATVQPARLHAVRPATRVGPPSYATSDGWMYLDDLLRREFLQDRGRGPARHVLHGRMVAALEPLVTRCRETLAGLIAPGGPDSNQQLTGPAIHG